MENTTTPHKKGTSVYSIVTDRILAQLSKGVVPWEKPWVAGSSAPMNFITRAPYKGVNRLLLPMPGEYLTARQVEALHGTLTPEAEKHIVTFFTIPERPARRAAASEEEEKEEAARKKRFPVFKYYGVYHLSQVEGIPSKLEAESENGAFLRPDVEADRLVADYCARTGVRVVSIHGDRAAYNADTDTVTVPELSQFRNSESYYGTLFHELVHSTGAAARLGRDVKAAAYGADEFTREELAAEIGANMLLAHCGLDTLRVFRNGVARIAGWIDALRGDERLVVNASRDAEKAVALILGEA